jgi:hypothetical protein
MKIIGTTKKTTPCIWTNIGVGIEGLKKYLNCEVIIYDHLQWQQRQIDADSDELIFIFEAGTPFHTGWTLPQIKQYFPNSKLVPLAADASIFILERGQHQLDYNYIDLWLDCDQRCVDIYRNLGIDADIWMWTISDWFIDYITSYYNHCAQSKNYDFIGVYGPYTLEVGDRGHMLSYLKKHNFSFTNGGGNGPDDNDIDRLIDHFIKSKITLGTTSHTIPNFHGIKGFRDWIGPFTNTPLIYDDWHLVQKLYGDIVPYYRYNHPEDIVDLFYKVDGNFEIINKQQLWAIENTIDKQLCRLLQKYGLLKNEDFILHTI